MEQYYAAECTANPIWLVQQYQGKFWGVEHWDTFGVFHSRERAQRFLEATSHRYSKKTRVYSIPLTDEKLAIAMAEIRNEVDE